MRKRLMYIFAVLCIVGCSPDNDTSSNSGNGNGNSGGGNGNPIAANQQAVGVSANDILSDISFTSMIVELAYVTGFKPSDAAIQNFTEFLEERIHKPEGIQIELVELPSPGLDQLSIQDIINIEDNNRERYNNGNEIALWFYFSDGESSSNTENGAVLGTAYRNTSFVVFQETIEDLSGAVFQPDRTLLETTVITHEIGHLFGLTNLGTPLQSAHEDPDHPKHCDVEDCLMYWAAETDSGLESMINNSEPPALDAQCIADLQANGGK